MPALTRAIDRHSIPAAMTVCQKSAARKATTIMRRIRPACRDQRPCRGRSAGRDRSCETTRSPASEPTSPDIDKDFLNRPLAADAGRRIAARRPARRALAHRNSPAETALRSASAGAIGAARPTILIGRWLAPALITEPAAATCINASREGFTPRQPALTGNGGE